MMGIMFMLFIAAAVVTLCMLSEMTEIFGTLIGCLILAGLTFICFSAWTPMLQFIRHNPRTCIQLALSYFLLGVLWSFVKFALEARKERKDSETLSKKWIFDRLMPRVSTWIILWPFSILASLLTDWIDEMMRFFVEKIKFIYWRILSWVVKA